MTEPRKMWTEKKVAIGLQGESTPVEIAGRCPVCLTLLISPASDGRTAEGAATEQSVLMGRPASAINCWTSVVDLPKEMERVWLWVKTSSGPQTEDGGYAVEGRRLNLPDGHPTWVHNDGDTLVESGAYGRVTHWQPLPKPPGLGESREPLPTATDIQNESSPGAIRPEPLIYDGREIQTVDGEPRMRNKLPSVPAEIESQCSGPFSDARECPIHSKDVFSATSPLHNDLQDCAMLLRKVALSRRTDGLPVGESTREKVQYEPLHRIVLGCRPQYVLNHCPDVTFSLAEDGLTLIIRRRVNAETAKPPGLGESREPLT